MRNSANQYSAEGKFYQALRPKNMKKLPKSWLSTNPVNFGCFGVGFSLVIDSTFCRFTGSPDTYGEIKSSRKPQRVLARNRTNFWFDRFD
jgi:hypothetical protein